MKVLRIVGGQGSGKSQALQSIKAGAWMLDGKMVPTDHILRFAVLQSRLNDVGNMIDRTGFKPAVLMLDVEAELSPKAQQHLIQIAESRGVQHLFLAYNE